MSVSHPSHATSYPQPKIMSAVRKFGRYRGFTNLSPTASSSLGSKSVGQVNIECQLRFQRSRWGTLRGLPAGILYLDLNLGPPSDCRISNATVTITLDGDDPCLRPYKARRPPEEPRLWKVPVTITEWFGPQYMVGDKKSADSTSTIKATPEFSLLGYSLGGLGYETAKSLKNEARWSLNGQLLQGQRTPFYQSLRWHYNWNELEGQAFHNPKFRTAFAFEHSGQPFIMKVEIEGKLARWHHRMKSKFKFDGPRERNVITLVDFEDHRRFSDGLDLAAQDLDSAMIRENRDLVPPEISDTRPDNGEKMSPPDTPQQALGSTIKSTAVNHANEQHLRSDSNIPTLGSSVQNLQGRSFISGTKHIEQTLYRVDDWRIVVAEISRPRNQSQGPSVDDPVEPAHFIGGKKGSLVYEENARDDSDRAQEASTSTTIRIGLVDRLLMPVDTILDPQMDRDAVWTILSMVAIITMMVMMICVY